MAKRFFILSFTLLFVSACQSNTENAQRAVEHKNINATQSNKIAKVFVAMQEIDQAEIKEEEELDAKNEKELNGEPETFESQRKIKPEQDKIKRSSCLKTKNIETNDTSDDFQTAFANFANANCVAAESEIRFFNNGLNDEGKSEKELQKEQEESKKELAKSYLERENKRKQMMNVAESYNVVFKKQ